MKRKINSPYSFNRKPSITLADQTSLAKSRVDKANSAFDRCLSLYSQSQDPFHFELLKSAMQECQNAEKLYLFSSHQKKEHELTLEVNNE